MKKHEKNEMIDASEEWCCRDDERKCRRQGTETLAADEKYEALVEREWPLSNGAAPAIISTGIGVEGDRRLGCRLGLWEGGEEVEEEIHWYVTNIIPMDFFFNLVRSRWFVSWSALFCLGVVRWNIVCLSLLYRRDGMRWPGWFKKLEKGTPQY
jgi:hypothetical protein